MEEASLLRFWTPELVRTRCMCAVFALFSSVDQAFGCVADPGAPGLAVTSDGRPKIVDIVEATGSGDVEMYAERTTREGESSIVGLTGRTLRLNAAWTNPTGVWKVGVKPGFEFFPDGAAVALELARRCCCSRVAACVQG